MCRLLTLITFFIIVLTLFILINCIKNSKEKYQPKISDDVFKFMLLPNLDLIELNNLSLTNRRNYQNINNYLINKVGLPLSTINNLNYFSYVGDDEFPFISQNVQDDLNLQKRQTSNFILNILSNFFRLIQAKYVNLLDSLMIDYSNLPVFEKRNDFEASEKPFKILLNRNGLTVYLQDNENFNLLRDYFNQALNQKLQLQQENEQLSSIPIIINDDRNTISLGFGRNILSILDRMKGYEMFLQPILKREREIPDWLDDEMQD